MYDTHALRKKKSPVHSFFAKWNHLINKSESIPTIIKQRRKPQRDVTLPKVASPPPKKRYYIVEQLRRCPAEKG